MVHHTLPIDTSNFRMEELDKAIERTKKTTVGPDLIPLELWTQPPFKEQLLYLNNQALNRNIKPNSWSKSHINPIFKKGKVGNPLNYRGISLT